VRALPNMIKSIRLAVPAPVKAFAPVRQKTTG